MKPASKSRPPACDLLEERLVEGADVALLRADAVSAAISRTASITRAGSQLLGQRAVQVSQVRQSQIDSSASSLSRRPAWPGA